MSGFIFEGAAAPGDWESVIFDRELVECYPSLRAIKRDPPQMAVLISRISAGVGQKVLFRNSSPRGSEPDRPFCNLFVCFLFIYLLLAELLELEFAPWRPHRVSQL